MGNAIYRFEQDVQSYQQWSGYPPSRVGTDNFPYQCIIMQGVYTFLAYSTSPFWIEVTANPAILKLKNGGTFDVVMYQYGAWQLSTFYGDNFLFYPPVLQANNDIFTDSTLNTVYFEQTTPDSGMVKKRIRNIRHFVKIVYQQWSGYPQSPDSLNDYPYQLIMKNSNGEVALIVSKDKIYRSLYGGSAYAATTNSSRAKQYFLQNGAWYYNTYANDIYWSGCVIEYNGNSYYEANHDYYTDATLTSVYFAKTTSTSSLNNIRDRAIFYNTGEATILSAGFREFSKFSEYNANVTVSMNSGAFNMRNNYTKGEGDIWLVLDKAWVNENNIVVSFDMQSDGFFNPNDSGLVICEYDGEYFYNSLVDLPDHADIQPKGTTIFGGIVTLYTFVTKRTYSMDLKTANIYWDGVLYNNLGFTDWYSNPKTWNDFQSDKVTIQIGKYDSGTNHDRTFSFSNFKLKDGSNNILWQLDFSTYQNELTGTIHDYGKFDLPTGGWERVNV